MAIVCDRFIGYLIASAAKEFGDIIRLRPPFPGDGYQTAPVTPLLVNHNYPTARTGNSNHLRYGSFGIGRMFNCLSGKHHVKAFIRAGNTLQ
jgi:hypothetical protein